MKFSELEIGSVFSYEDDPDCLRKKIGSNTALTENSIVVICGDPEVVLKDSSDFPSDKNDAVNHPSHYGGADNPYEAIKIIDALGLTKGFCLGSAIKYIVREGSKQDNPAVQDLQKAAWYINYYIDHLKKEGVYK